MPAGALSRRAACSGGKRSSLSASLSSLSACALWAGVPVSLGATYSGGGASASMISSVRAEPGRGSTLRR